MSCPSIYRRRFKPNETIHLKDDIILKSSSDFMLTKWTSLRPRKDIAHGISAYYIDQGIKVSKIFDGKDQLLYWYCDIIQTKWDTEKNTVIFEDLLLDVVLYNDGSIHVLDLDELSDALEQGFITQAEATYALRTLDSLLKILYQGQFHVLQEPVNQAEMA